MAGMQTLFHLLAAAILLFLFVKTWKGDEKNRKSWFERCEEGTHIFILLVVVYYGHEGLGLSIIHF